MQKFAHFLRNCWTVLCIKFFKLPHPYNAIIDNVLGVGVHFLSGHSVYVFIYMKLHVQIGMLLLHCSDKEWTIVGYEDASMSSAVENVKIVK